LPYTVLVVHIFLIFLIFFFADDANEYQMKRASKKSIELQTAYVYRKSTPRRHHYSGGEMKAAVINVFSLANAHNLTRPPVTPLPYISQHTQLRINLTTVTSFCFLDSDLRQQW